MRTDLARFFSPRSIAIIGASQDLISISGQPLKHLVTHKYAGKLYPVNPRYPEILGVKCYPTLAALPETPDLALVLINASRVATVLRECVNAAQEEGDELAHRRLSELADFVDSMSGWYSQLRKLPPGGWKQLAKMGGAMTKLLGK
jgi:hypothetical protein